MEIAERILNAAEGLFLKYGIKSITMDDIARKIAISKKTIYQFYQDKDSLIEAVMQRHLQKQGEDLTAISRKAVDPVDETLKISEYIKKSLESINPSILFDIEKYHPKSFRMFQKHQDTKVHAMLLENMQQGRDMGLYRADINMEMLARLRMEEIRFACNPAVFPEAGFLPHEIHHELTMHFIHGVCTLKGHKLINKYKQIEEDLT